MIKKINRILDVISKEEVLNMLLSSVRSDNEANPSFDEMIDASFEIEWRQQFSDKDDVNPLLIKDFLNEIIKQNSWIKKIYNKSNNYLPDFDTE